MGSRGSMAVANFVIDDRHKVARTRRVLFSSGLGFSVES